MPTWFTYRPKWSLRNECAELFKQSEQLFVAVLADVDRRKEEAENLHVLGHTATANVFFDRRKALIAEHEEFIASMLRTYDRNDKRVIETTITLLEEHNAALRTAQPLLGWENSPRHELALRGEIGAKVKRINSMREDLTHMMPSRLSLLINAHNIEVLEEFASTMKKWSLIEHEPRLKHFHELEQFMQSLLQLDRRMHDLKRMLKDMH